MYYPPPLFAPVRPFESRPNTLEGAAATAGDVPVVVSGTRENPLDLSVKNLRQGSDSSVVEGEDLLMLEHRKLASLAAAHSLSAMGRQLVPGAAAALLDPTLYRLAYGPEALVPSPFCYDRATGVAVPTSLASHQLMSSILQQQQRDRCLEQQQQQALLAARSTAAQQAAVAAALMDPSSSLQFGLRGAAMTQREAAAALAATRGLYPPTLPTPVVLPGFPLYAATDEKGAYASLRNGSTDKSYLNGATAVGTALEAARFAEHLQRLREQHIQQTAGKCTNACCTTLSGLGTSTVPCACCIQSPSQAALCARSPIGGCIKDPATAATAAKVCSTACDYLQPGLTYLHRPAAATAVTSSSELKLPVSSLCSTTTNSSSTTTASSSTSGCGFQPITSWTNSLPGSSASGKTAFSVPKKKEHHKDTFSHKDVKNVNVAKDITANNTVHHYQDSHKREKAPTVIPTTTTAGFFSYHPPPVSAISIKRENTTRGGDADLLPKSDINTSALLPPYQKKEHDVKSILTPKTTTVTTTNFLPKSMGYVHGHVGSGAQTTVTAVTPIVPTKWEGGTIPKTTKVPATPQSFRPVVDPPKPTTNFLVEQLADSASSRLPPPQHLQQHQHQQRRSPSSPQGPPPLIAVGKVSHATTAKTGTNAVISSCSASVGAAAAATTNNGFVKDYRSSYQTADALRHQALLHGGCLSNLPKNVSSAGGFVANNSCTDKFNVADIGKNQKTCPKNLVGTNTAKTNTTMTYIKEEPVSKPVPPISIPKPIPQHPTTKLITHITPAAPHFTSPYLPFNMHNNWMPPAHPNVTVAPIPPKNPITTTMISTVTSTNTMTTTGHHKVVKSEPLPILKKEPDYSYSNSSNNVLQSLLVRPNGTVASSTTSSGGNIGHHHHQHHQQQHHHHQTHQNHTTPVCMGNATSVAPIAAATSAGVVPAAALQHNACSVIMPNPSTYPLLEYQYQHMIRGLNGLNLSRGTQGPAAADSGCPAIASTAPIQKFEPKLECGGVGASECIASRLPKKRPNSGPFTPLSTTTTTVGAAASGVISSVATMASAYGEKKRCIATDTHVAPVPGQSNTAQFQPISNGFKDVPHRPYTFVPEPQIQLPSQHTSKVVSATKDARPVRSVSCSTDTPPELEIMEEVEPEQQQQQRQPPCQAVPITCTTEVQTPPLGPTTPVNFLAEIQVKNARRSAQARASCKLRKRCLASIFLTKRKLTEAESEASSSTSPPHSSWKYRRHLYRVLPAGDGPRSSQLLRFVQRTVEKRRKRRLVYKIKRQEMLSSPVGDEKCSDKVADPCSSLPIPAEMKKIMVNKALGETVLHRAARLGYVEVVAYCLETNASQINSQDNAGYTPLHECCSRGHLDIARALLQYGADVNASAAGGIRPLHDAVENDHVEVVRLLLSYGADPSIATYSGLTPLKLARSALMAEFLQGFIADVSGEMECRPYLPWKFWGSSSCLDLDANGYDVFDGVPSDGEQPPEGEGDDFVFEVSDSPHLPTFRLVLGSSKAHSNYLRLSDILRKMQISKEHFLEHHGHIEVVPVPRYEFEAVATCSQLLSGPKLDNLLPYRERPDGLDCGPTVELVRLDNAIRKVLGIETISVR